MLENIILSFIQGITEWLPISSEGIITLISLIAFKKDLSSALGLAIVLHLGTLLAALIYFKKDILKIIMALIKPKNAPLEYKKILFFLIISSLITGLIGLPLLELFLNFSQKVESNTKLITGFIGILLIITGLAQIKKPEQNFKTANQLVLFDAFLLGFAQGLAVLPGLSRSGLTIAALLFRRFQDSTALRLSFLMSIPAIFSGNILFKINNLNQLDILSFNIIFSILIAFLVGLISIHTLIVVSRKINFGWFAIIFGLLTNLSLFI